MGRKERARKECVQLRKQRRRVAAKAAPAAGGAADPVAAACRGAAGRLAGWYCSPRGETSAPRDALMDATGPQRALRPRLPLLLLLLPALLALAPGAAAAFQIDLAALDLPLPHRLNVSAASVTQTRTGCYARLETPEGFLDSPNYPADYPPGLDCCYDIARPSTSYCGVKLYAEQLVVGKQPSDGAFCQTDWLAMESCVPEGGSRYCGNLTGSTYQFLFQPGSRALRFQFHSSGGSRRPRPVAGAVLRFRLRYRLLRSCRGLFQEPAVGALPGPGPSRPCYARVRNRRGAIHTPGYPQPYPPGQDCVYEFVRPNPFICGVRMRSTSFELEPSVSTPFGGACSDFLQTPGCGFLCGSLNFTWLAVYQPGATSQRFHFHSDDENNFNGFFITFEQVYHCPDS
ncbi:neuropilin-2-like [Schistocerca gregaria]|uniref:neuropilin-2-like n=1 Tax=Schistocerca gregaria TaxID=7010 RepID=UPI00211EEC54|nr:neuropilin-2-like [Schistocerca gregaria]